MAEYFINIKPDNSIDLPKEVRDLLALEPGDKMVIRLDHAEEHLVIGKLPMDSKEKAREIDNNLGRPVKIEQV